MGVKTSSASPGRDWARGLGDLGEKGSYGACPFGGWEAEESLSSLPLGVARSHPSPAEYVEVLQELQRLESRLHPFLQRYCEVLGAAASTDYNNNVSLPSPSPGAHMGQAGMHTTLSPKGIVCKEVTLP